MQIYIEDLRALKNNNANFYWYQKDAIILITEGYVWTYVKKKIQENSISKNLFYRKFECIEIFLDYITKNVIEDV